MVGFEMMPTVSIVAIEKKFAVSLRPKDRTGNDSRIEALRLDGVADASTGEFVKLGIAHDSSFADVGAAHFKLRFHQDDQAMRRGKKRHDGGNQHRGRD